MTKTTKGDLLMVFNQLYPWLSERQKTRILSLFYQIKESINGKCLSETDIEIAQSCIRKILKDGKND